MYSLARKAIYKNKISKHVIRTETFTCKYVGTTNEQVVFAPCCRIVHSYLFHLKQKKNAKIYVLVSRIKQTNAEKNWRSDLSYLELE